MQSNFVVCNLIKQFASFSLYKDPESAPITDPNFWNFNIWDLGVSYTTTTPPTMGTMTTRSISTTTVNTLVIFYD